MEGWDSALPIRAAWDAAHQRLFPRSPIVQFFPFTNTPDVAAFLALLLGLLLLSFMSGLGLAGIPRLEIVNRENPKDEAGQNRLDRTASCRRHDED